MNNHQEKLLTQYYRKAYAKILRNERASYRLGAEDLSKRKNLFFVSKHYNETPFILHNGDELQMGKFIIEAADFAKTLTKWHTPLKIILGVSTNIDAKCSGCYCDSCGDHDPTISFASWVYKFKNAKTIKRQIQTVINDRIKDARWKFAHQPNGKDAKRYLEIINSQE